VTVDSYYVPVHEMRVLKAGLRERLAALGLISPEKRARSTRRWTGADGQKAARGLSEQRMLQLRALGIRTVEDLQRWRADDLVAALRGNSPRPSDCFLGRGARVWVGGKALCRGADTRR
jgi:hypothetical protein